MLKLHAGVSKKVGLPGFSSASASCTIKAELDSSLLQYNGFQYAVKARQAGYPGKDGWRKALFRKAALADRSSGTAQP
jgi:hypothetical protein